MAQHTRTASPTGSYVSQSGSVSTRSNTPDVDIDDIDDDDLFGDLNDKVTNVCARVS
jgi:hypothetical protein